MTFSDLLSLYAMLEPFDFIVIDNQYDDQIYYVYNSQNNDILITDEDVLSGKIIIGVDI